MDLYVISVVRTSDKDGNQFPIEHHFQTFLSHVNTSVNEYWFGDFCKNTVVKHSLDDMKLWWMDNLGRVAKLLKSTKEYDTSTLSIQKVNFESIDIGIPLEKFIL